MADTRITETRQRVWLPLLIIFLLAFCWLSMLAVHELGHVLHAGASGATVQRVVLHPLAISRTDVSPNPHPQFVAWGGAIWGTLIPLGLWIVARLLGGKYAHLAAFFAGFCCLANGLYLAAGSFGGIGDAGELIRHGAAVWQLWLFGLPASLLGLWLWNGLGPRFGFGRDTMVIEPWVVIWLGIAVAIIAIAEILLSSR